MAETVLITGASCGIGMETARLFHSNGFNVVINYNNSEKAAIRLSQELSGSIALKADVSDESAVCSMVEAATQHFGKIDVLVNNAGIASDGLVTDISSDEWKRIFDVNVFGTFLVTKYILPQMINRKKGRIVNLASMWGRCGASFESCYSASKGAVIAFTKSLAKELGPSGININCVAPGFIDTAMNDNISKEDAESFCAATPLGRMGSCRDVAQAIYFLSSSSADFITGQIISPDGGAVI